MSEVLESSRVSAPERDAAAWDQLGLTTVRTLVASYGGDVRVEIGSGGRDSIFTVRLPGEAQKGA